MITMSKDMADFATDAELADIDTEDYRQRLENEKLTDISRKKIVLHLQVLKNRKDFAHAMVAQITTELEYLRTLFDTTE